MFIKTIISFAALLILSNTAYSQQFEKNGYPCVAEICIGDGLAELEKVEWDRAIKQVPWHQKPVFTSQKKLSDIELKSVQKKFRGDLNKSAQYLSEGTFDSLGLHELFNVKVACDKHFLKGQYTTKSGHPTTVFIQLTTNLKDTSTQKWMVTQIRRLFPSAASEQQKSEIRQEFTKRYKKFGNDSNIYKIGLIYFKETWGVEFGFDLGYYWGSAEQQFDSLRAHPSCGGKTKIGID